MTTAYEIRLLNREAMSDLDLVDGLGLRRRFNFNQNTLSCQSKQSELTGKYETLDSFSVDFK